MIDRVVQELAAQDAKWGCQRHLPLIGDDPFQFRRSSRRRHYAACEEYWKSLNDSRTEGRVTGWDTILLEEVYEALAAEEVADQITELVQVAAVAIQAAMALERAA